MTTSEDRTRRWVLTLCAAVAVWVFTGASATAQLVLPTDPDTSSDTATSFKLGVGVRKFWPPEPQKVNQAAVVDPLQCNTTTLTPCWEYTLTIAPGGARLRVALSVVLQNPGDVRPAPDMGPHSPEHFRLQLFAPGDNAKVAQTCEGSQGERVECDYRTARDGTLGLYAAELFARQPVEGVWTVRVIPERVVNLAFRMRARLEGPAESTETVTSDPVPLSPNLRIIPPFEFTFATAPATMTGGAQIPMVHPSCMAEEVREALENGEPIPTLCLRYSMGIENAGDGPFRLMGWGLWRPYTYENEHGDLVTEPGTASADQYQTQRRLYSDGAYRDDAFAGAGIAHLDPSHGHYHWKEAWRFELYEISDANWRWPEDQKRKPALLDTQRRGQKMGVNTTHEYMTDWTRFYQNNRDQAIVDDPPAARPGCVNPTGGLVTYYCLYELDLVAEIHKGWGDIYEWNRGGNYVDLPTVAPGVPIPKAGYYVLRGEADPERRIFETNEDDNFSYALIWVSSDGTVHLLERGYGTDPWDPHKRVLVVSP